MIKDGVLNIEIIDVVLFGMMNIDKIECICLMLCDGVFVESWCDLDVIYIFGFIGVGKIWLVMDVYGYCNCYCVIDYKYFFDIYDG